MRRVSTRVELRRDVGRVGPADGPWIRRRQVSKIWGPADPASLAELTDHRGQTLGWGLLAPDSEIPLRLLGFGAAPPPADWLARRMQTARAGRAALGLGLGEADAPTTGFRAINSEGDGLPGLTVDCYGPDTVIQIATAAMAVRQAEIAALVADFTPGRIFITSPQQAAEREGFVPAPQLHGDDATLEFRELGLQFAVPAPPAQKTGAYLDQRDNRALVARLARVSGGRLLDVGCHVGGFALHAAALGVDAVGLDQSAKRPRVRAHQRRAQRPRRADRVGAGRHVRGARRRRAGGALRGGGLRPAARGQQPARRRPRVGSDERRASAGCCHACRRAASRWCAAARSTSGARCSTRRCSMRATARGRGCMRWDRARPPGVAGHREGAYLRVHVYQRR
jgi:23S rRNA (cytosine1962-C5)-methyltransferase